MDQLIIAFDRIVRVLSGTIKASRSTPCPKSTLIEEHTILDNFKNQKNVQSEPSEYFLSCAEKKQSTGLIRVNHVGEICAQALYHAQGLAARSEELKTLFAHAAREEEDHLVWTSTRLHQLNAYPSYLVPLWYSGAFIIGYTMGRINSAVSLGFMAETERQVEQHLDLHLERLPKNDHYSRAILEQMRSDEIAHSQAAERAGACALPGFVKWGMRTCAKIMTTTAYYI